MIFLYTFFTIRPLNYFSICEFFTKSLDGDTGINRPFETDIHKPTYIDPGLMQKNTVSTNHGRVKVDKKDTENFKYYTYMAQPIFPLESACLLSKYLTAEAFEKLRGVETNMGYTFSNAIQVGAEDPSSLIGVTAGDEDSWTKFKDIFLPIVKEINGVDASQKCDTRVSNLVVGDADRKFLAECVTSISFAAARNLSGAPLLPGNSFPEEVESDLKEIFSGFQGNLVGTYTPLSEFTDDQKLVLQESGALFLPPEDGSKMQRSGATRNWPDGRGLFKNIAGWALCWVNEEDHCRIIVNEESANVQLAFSRFAELSSAFSNNAKTTGHPIMMSKDLGYLTVCPSNVGTGLRVTFVVDNLSELDKIKGDATSLCSSRGISIKQSNGKWSLQNKQTLGLSELEIVQNLVDTTLALGKINQKLAFGGDVSVDFHSPNADESNEFALTELNSNLTRRDSFYAVGDKKDTGEHRYLKYSVSIFHQLTTTLLQ